MIKVNKFVSFTKADFKKLLDVHVLNKRSVASSVGLSRAAITKKNLSQSERFELTFSQAFTLYAQLHLSQSDFEEIIKIMIEDGFEVDYE